MARSILLKRHASGLSKRTRARTAKVWGSNACSRRCSCQQWPAITAARVASWSGTPGGQSLVPQAHLGNMAAVFVQYRGSQQRLFHALGAARPRGLLGQPGYWGSQQRPTIRYWHCSNRRLLCIILLPLQEFDGLGHSICPEWLWPIPQVLEPAVCGLPWVSVGGNLPEGVV